MGNLSSLARPTVAGLYVVAACSLAGLQVLHGSSETGWTAVVVSVVWCALALGIYLGHKWVLVLAALSFPVTVVAAWLMGAASPGLPSGSGEALAALMMTAQAPFQFGVILFDGSASLIGSPESWLAYAAHLGLLAVPIAWDGTGSDGSAATRGGQATTQRPKGDRERDRAAREARERAQEEEARQAAVAEKKRRKREAKERRKAEQRAKAEAEERAKAEAAARARPRTETLQLPADVLSIYVNNPYNVLGLAVEHAKTGKIKTRRDEMLRFLSAGLNPQDEPDFVHVGLVEDAALDAEVVKAAFDQLIDERSRIQSGLLWFWLEGAQDTVLAALRDGALDTATGVWKADAIYGSEQRIASGVHNLAIALHATALAAEAREPGARPEEDAYAEALRAWVSALESEEGWAFVDNWVAGSRDGRVDEDFAARLRPDLADRILGVHVALARSAVAQGWVEHAIAHIGLVRESSFPDGATNRALDAFFGHEVDSARDVVADIVEADALDDDMTANALREYAWIREAVLQLQGQSHLLAMTEAFVPRAVLTLQNRATSSVEEFIALDESISAESVALLGPWTHLLSSGGSPRPPEDELEGVREARSKLLGQSTELEKLERLRSRYAGIPRALGVLERVADDASSSTRTRVRDARGGFSPQNLEAMRSRLETLVREHESNLRSLSRLLGDS